MQLENCLHPPPWNLRGDAIAMLSRDLNGRLQSELWVHYTASPVGPYDEYARGQLRKFACKYLQTHWQPTIVEMRVSSERSRICGRANWGFPKTLHRLKWREELHRVVFENEAQAAHFRVSRLGLPLKISAYAVQVLAGAEVRVPMTISARAHLAWRGKRWGVMLKNFDFFVAPPEKLSP